MNGKILRSQPLRSGFLRTTTALVVILSAARDLSAQLDGQSFQVIPEIANPTVGDSVTLRFTARLHERDLLLDTVPRPVTDLPPGVRILSVEKLTRGADRVFRGKARVAFYRTGRRAVPVFGLSFMRNVGGISRAVLASDSAFVEVSRVLPAGDPPLKDIREADPTPGSRLVPVLALLMLSAGAILYRLAHRRRRRPAALVIEPAIPAAPATPTPYETALQGLNRIEREGWAGRDVARHYESAVEVLREYLEAAEQVGAHERTTSELLWSMPPHLTAGGLRNRSHELLSEADMVKFAKVRPPVERAAAFLAEARLLLESWHRARPIEQVESAAR